MTAQPQRILLWPATRALTLSLAEEALRAARRLHPEALYEPLFLLAEAPAEGGLAPAGNGLERQAGAMLAAVPGRRRGAGGGVASAGPGARNWRVRERAIGALSAGIAGLGLLDGIAHWRWHDDFTERFPVIATNHLFEWIATA